MIGPVQENDTNTNVRAMKNMPIKLVESDRASDLFIQDAGRFISKAPKNDMPNTRKRTKNTKFAIQLVARLFSAAGPNANVTKKPKKVKMMTMDAA
jgi:hypothetical protein